MRFHATLSAWHKSYVHVYYKIDVSLIWTEPVQNPNQFNTIWHLHLCLLPRLCLSLSHCFNTAIKTMANVTFFSGGCYIYHLQTTLREGNIFTSVCLHTSEACIPGCTWVGVCRRGHEVWGEQRVWTAGQFLVTCIGSQKNCLTTKKCNTCQWQM